MHSPLRLPQLREFKQSVREKYPDANVSCTYQYGAGVFISVSRSDFDEECVCTILGYLQPIVSDDVFIRDLFDLFEKESHDDPNWKNGMRPYIWLYLNVDGEDRYQFNAGANKENYNSGRDPSSYTWDGYTTWSGVEFTGKDGVPRKITSDKIME